MTKDLIIQIATTTMVTSSVMTVMSFLVGKLLLKRLEHLEPLKKVSETIPFISRFGGASERPDWDTYFMGIADAVAQRADCTRRKVGAVIVDQDHRIIATGYNGAPPGQGSCLAGDCPRGRHYPNPVEHPLEPLLACACGNVWPCKDTVDHGSSYDTGPGTCIAVHAEMNAISWCRERMADCAIYVTDDPCDGCLRAIHGVGIDRIITPKILSP